MLGGSEICCATDRASFRCSYVLNVIPQAMVQSVAIIGAGNMGSGIAQKSATEGFSVQMVDREEQWVDKGKDTIEKFLQEALERRIFRPEQAEGIKSRIRGVVGHENVSPDTDLVIEAVFEDFELRRRYSPVWTEHAGRTRFWLPTHPRSPLTSSPSR